jgi:delta-aminolevulinic acid dehydratase/porphobilinogen synthase
MYFSLVMYGLPYKAVAMLREKNKTEINLFGGVCVCVYQRDGHVLFFMSDLLQRDNNLKDIETPSYFA